MKIPGKSEIKQSIQEYFDEKGQCKLTMSKLRIKVLKLCEYSEEEYSIVNATLRKLLLEFMIQILGIVFLILKLLLFLQVFFL